MDSHQAGRTYGGDSPGRIAVVDEPGVSVLRLHGEIDSAAVAAYDDACDTGTPAGSSPPPSVIDASDVTFLDCRGLRLLVRATGASRRSGCRPVLRRPTRVVRRVIDVTGTEELFTITQ
jgi:anti-anti-sigma factor